MSKIVDNVLSFMKEDAYKPMSIMELMDVFDIDRGQLRDFTKILDNMESEGLIIKTRKDRYGVPDRMNLVVGKLQGNEKGFGFVIADDETINDVFIPSESLNGAMNNDRVIARISKQREDGKHNQGEIIRIIERANEKVVGTFEKSRNFGFVVPDDKRIYHDIFISKSNMNSAKDGYKVVAKITKWPDGRRNPEGKIFEILGKKDKPGVDILSIIKKYDLPEAFPDEVIKYTDRIPEEIPEEEYEKRRDLRNLKIVTIDGEDAKDLDDAVSIEKLPDGKFKLGVHIADVTHYVREKTPLDREAFKRGTSVYLVDRVIPMLPKKLSNGLCSLNPKVDRLTLSCMMIIDQNGKVCDHEIFESIIRTSERMTYTDVTKILRDKDEETIKRYDYLVEDFKLMEELCGILNRKRMQRGALDFDFQESKIILDESGKPIDIKPYEREIANRIIEEFMLVCNETVAEHMFWTGMPFVYRVHEDPDSEKLEVFKQFVYNLGYFVKPYKEVHPKFLQDIITEAKGKPEETVVNTILLRSLAKARYSPECLGHFGLAAKYYCHFTSPIRRYPDLSIHRIIKAFINGKIDAKMQKRFTRFVQESSKHSSDMELVADDAERETEDLKKVEFMQDKVGKTFKGIISSVTSFGMFVELENTVEGLIHISNLIDDYYIYDEAHYSLVGQRTKKIYRLGDEIRVKVVRADMESMNIDFVLADNEDFNE